jgi:beta-N-acetylhexosaminidase
MSLADQVAQLVLIGTPVTNAASAAATVREYHVGGVFLAGRSSLSAAALRQAIGALQSASTAPGRLRLQIALDQEGGEVQTLSGPDFPTFPSAVKEGALSTGALRSQTIDWAKRLAGIGVTIDLAPVADTVPAGTEKDNPPIGAFERQYGSDPVAVAKDVSTVVSAVQSTGVMTTLKHFPGLGRVKTNTDTGTGATDSVATTHDPYLGPFASGIKAGSGAVMISLATYPKLDSHSIAAFSKPIVTDLLRGQLGFKGLIVSDDLGSAVAVSSVPIGERAVRFIKAGGDMALSVRTSDAKPMTTALLAEAKGSPSFAATVSAAVKKVLASKYQAGVLSCAPQP